MVNIKASFSARGRSISPEQLNQIERRCSTIWSVSRSLARPPTPTKRRPRKPPTNVWHRQDARRFRRRLSRQLKTVGMTEEALRAKMVEQATAEAVAERELKINVTDADAKKFYEENPAKFEQPEMVRASHILLMTDDRRRTRRCPTINRRPNASRLRICSSARGPVKISRSWPGILGIPASKDKGGELTFARGQMVRGIRSRRVFAEHQPGQRRHHHPVRLSYHQAQRKNSGPKNRAGQGRGRTEGSVAPAGNAEAAARLYGEIEKGRLRGNPGRKAEGDSCAQPGPG